MEKDLTKRMVSYFTEEEAKNISNQAKENQMSVSSYLRKCIIENMNQESKTAVLQDVDENDTKEIRLKLPCAYVDLFKEKALQAGVSDINFLKALIVKAQINVISTKGILEDIEELTKEMADFNNQMSRYTDAAIAYGGFEGNSQKLSELVEDMNGYLFEILRRDVKQKRTIEKILMKHIGIDARKGE